MATFFCVYVYDMHVKYHQDRFAGNGWDDKKVVTVRKPEGYTEI